ncbi:MAG: PilZ domain-containing protein [Gammaproteobacteria bacterium]|nr:PilZ domain-containing protein [Gammaproteobacteria bacterium]
MRNFIRHASDIPIDFQLEELVSADGDFLRNVSHGGLAFHSQVEVQPGVVIRVRIPLVHPVFQAVGQVTWCRPEEGAFEVGIQFLDRDDQFRARMVEQICHIEQYKQKIRQEQGRLLNGEQAAAEWINQFATEFSDPEDTP